MGFETDLFQQQPVDDNFICSICHNVLERPMVACANAHTFCEECIDAWEEQSQICPDCRTETLDTNLFNRPLENVIMSLQVKCGESKTESSPSKKRAHTGASVEASTKEKCDWRGTLSDYLERHRKSECEFRTVQCPLECGNTITVSQLQTHIESECINRQVVCVECQEEFPESLRFYHEGFKCLATLVSCQLCSTKVPRGELGRLPDLPHGSSLPSELEPVLNQGNGCTGHYATCPKLPLTCAFAKYGCSALLVREQLDKHLADFASEHAKMVAAKIEQVEDNLKWTNVNMSWSIPSYFLRQASKISYDGNLMLQSDRFCAGEWITLLRFVVSKGVFHVFVCVQKEDDQMPPGIDQVFVDVKNPPRNSKVWNHWYRDVKFKRDVGILKLPSTWSVGGYLRTLENGTSRPTTPTDLLESCEADKCIIKASFRLKAPDEVVVGCRSSKLIAVAPDSVGGFLH